MTLSTSLDKEGSPSMNDVPAICVLSENVNCILPEACNSVSEEVHSVTSSPFAKHSIPPPLLMRKLFAHPLRSFKQPLTMSVDEEQFLRRERASTPSSVILTLGDRSYKVRETIGIGFNGFVKLATDMTTGKKVALKAISKTSPSLRSNQIDNSGRSSAENFMEIENTVANVTCVKSPCMDGIFTETTPATPIALAGDQKALSRVLREIQLLKLLHHPNIVQLYDVYETPTHYLLAMEHVEGGELFHYILRHGRLTERRARRIFRQVVSAVLYCHDNFVVHRDLKPENVLLDRKKNVKLIDFGFSNQFGFDHNPFLNTFCGSPNYAAPEIILGIKYSAPEVDVWSLGVILYVLLTGVLPFKGRDLETTYRNVLQGKPNYPSYLSQDAVRLTRSMLRVNVPQRISLEAVLRSAWLCKNEPDRVAEIQPVRTLLANDQIDAHIFNDLLAFGYTREMVLENLSREAANPIRNMYYLILERDARRHAEKETAEEAQQKKQKHRENGLFSRFVKLFISKNKAQTMADDSEFKTT